MEVIDLVIVRIESRLYRLEASGIYSMRLLTTVYTPKIKVGH